MKTRKIAQVLTALALAATMTAPVMANAAATWTEKTESNTWEGSVSGTDVQAEQNQNTNVTLNADPTYIVTIPATINLTDTDSNDIYEGSGEITATKIHLEKGSSLRVAIKSDFTLSSTTSATDKLLYQASTSDKFDPVLTDGGLVGTFESNVGDTPDDPLTVYFKTTEKLTNAGSYSDTVTFTFTTTVPAV